MIVFPDGIVQDRRVLLEDFVHPLLKEFLQCQCGGILCLFPSEEFKHISLADAAARGAREKSEFLVSRV